MHGLSCFLPHGIFLNQGSNPYLLYRQADSPPLWATREALIFRLENPSPPSSSIIPHTSGFPHFWLLIFSLTNTSLSALLFLSLSLSHSLSSVTSLVSLSLLLYDCLSLSHLSCLSYKHISVSLSSLFSATSGIGSQVWPPDPVLWLVSNKQPKRQPSISESQYQSHKREADWLHLSQHPALVQPAVMRGAERWGY